MKKILPIATLSALLASSAAFATSIHPCTPRVPIDSLLMKCIDETPKAYTIRVETYASPDLRMCKGRNYHESRRAHVTVRKGGLKTGEYVIFNDFTLELLPRDAAMFRSEKPYLDLRDCKVAVRR